MVVPPQNDNKPKSSPAVIAACIAAACAVAAPIAMRWEGFAPKVYKDPANISTWCYGETLVKLSQDPTFIYSKDQCASLLRQRMARDYAPKILQCIPQLIDPQRKQVFGALIDASYNAGWQGVCKSPMRAQIYAGHWEAACDALPTYYITAQKRVNGKRVGKPFVLKGLVNRRKDERKVCLLAA
jgi:GH24 family phage-related lysozyme (muramidase)